MTAVGSDAKHTAGALPASPEPIKTVIAAGTVVLDATPGREPKVLLVHRPQYDDWTLPKGKLRPGESLPACAVRETEEETGVLVRLGMPINTIGYMVGGGDKVVHYWRGYALSSRPRRPDREVDKVTWVTVRTALARMSYGDERNLLDLAVAMAPTTPLVILRHGKAMARKNWTGRDQARPVDARGRRQSSALVPLLDAYGVRELASSSSTRCVQTLKPFSKASGLDIATWSMLSEEVAETNAKGVAKLMRRLVQQTAASASPLVICGHRPVLPAMLDAAGIPPQPMSTAAMGIAHLDAASQTVAVEWHRPRI